MRRCHDQTVPSRSDAMSPTRRDFIRITAATAAALAASRHVALGRLLRPPLLQPRIRSSSRSQRSAQYRPRRSWR